MASTKQNKLELIAIKDIEPNKGQIEGLPKNPRKIQPHRFEKLKKSIEDAPELLDYRRLLVFPHNGKYVVVAGNMRLKAAKELGHTEMPCYILDESTSAEKLREYAIKDNVGFGEDDFSLMKFEWNLPELTNWGMEIEAPTEEPSSEIHEVELKPFEKVHYLITLDLNKNDKVVDLIAQLKQIDGVEVQDTLN